MMYCVPLHSCARNATRRGVFFKFKHKSNIFKMKYQHTFFFEIFIFKKNTYPGKEGQRVVGTHAGSGGATAMGSGRQGGGEAAE
jgi:hypothetical protein